MVKSNEFVEPGEASELQLSNVAEVTAITPLFTKLEWPGDSKENLRLSSQDATYLPHTVEA